MDTLTPARTSRAVTLALTTTHPTQFVDVTEHVQDVLTEAGVRDGLVNVQTLHTTTGIVVNEHEPLLLLDLEACLERFAPLTRSYLHNDLPRRASVTPAERRNGHAHCRALLLPASACLNVRDGRLVLGRWQRIFLVELDGPQARQLSIAILGDGPR